MTRPAAFVRRRFSPLRILWSSRMAVALGLLALGLGMTFHVEGTPIYVSVLMLGGGGVLAALLWRDTASMWRAARDGEVRQAVITGFSTTNWHAQGFTLYRMQWRDATGTKGQTGPRRRDRLPATGTRIIVCADPASGRTWWEDML